MFLETPRLLLRAATPQDLAELVALDQDPEVMRYLGYEGRPSSEVIGSPDHWAATLRETGVWLGWFGLRPLAGDGEARELGYRLKREAWGHGYATEGAKALVRKAFTDLGVRRVVAFTMAVNAASRRVMEKAGLTYVRTFHAEWDDPLPGSELGEVEYAAEKTQH